MAQKKKKKQEVRGGRPVRESRGYVGVRSGRGTDVLAGSRMARGTGMKVSAREGVYSSNITPTERQRSCKSGTVYSTKLGKCVPRKGADPRFKKDRPQKARKALSDQRKKNEMMRSMASPGPGK